MVMALIRMIKMVTILMSVVVVLVRGSSVIGSDDGIVGDGDTNDSCSCGAIVAITVVMVAVIVAMVVVLVAELWEVIGSSGLGGKGGSTERKFG